MTRIARFVCAALLAVAWGVSSAWAVTARGPQPVGEVGAPLRLPGTVVVSQGLEGVAPLAITPALMTELAAPVVTPAAPTVQARLSAITESISAEVAAAADLGKTGAEGSSEIGQTLINKVLGQKEAPSSGAPAAPAASGKSKHLAPAQLVEAAQALSDRLGLRERILKGGGVTLGTDGAALPAKKPIKASVFDIDGNLLNLPTNNYVRHKQTGEVIGIVNTDYFHVKSEIGKSGRYKDYELYDLDKKYGGSYRETLDIYDPDVFSKHMDSAFSAMPAREWMGLSWSRLVAVQNNDELSPWSSLNTARGHESGSIAHGFAVPVEKGYLKRAPREELIFGVTSPLFDQIMSERFPGVRVDPADRKVVALIAYLDIIESVPLANKEDYHSLGFSDDDTANMDRVRSGVRHLQVVRRRWPHIKISLFLTHPETSHTEIYVAGAKIKE